MRSAEIRELRPFQRESIEALRRPSGHVICVSATGSGKSLIYEVLASQDRLRTLLITPLVALGRQQSRNLEEAGLKVAVNGESAEPRPDCWIASPEAALSPVLRSRWKAWKPELLVVDECHCLWDWGERFRPAFQRIPELLAGLAIPRSLWLTATLPSQARAELVSALPEQPKEIGSFALPSKLRLDAPRIPWARRAEALFAWVGAHPEPGLVFVNTRSGTDRVSRLIRSCGREAVPYHAGLAKEERLALEARLRRKEADIWVTTSAFGMGMDHRFLRWVLLWQAPASLLAMTQAIGRAGRDPTLPSHAAIFWDEDDFHLLSWATQSQKLRTEIRQMRHFLHAPGCRRENLTGYFEGPSPSKNSSAPCLNCDLCLKTGSSWAFRRKYPKEMDTM